MALTKRQKQIVKARAKGKAKGFKSAGDKAFVGKSVGASKAKAKNAKGFSKRSKGTSGRGQSVKIAGKSTRSYARTKSGGSEG